MTQSPNNGMEGPVSGQGDGASPRDSDSDLNKNSDLNGLILTVATVFILFVGLGPYFFPPGSSGAVFVGLALLAIVSIAASIILRKQKPWMATIAVLAAFLVIAGSVVKWNSLFHGIGPRSNQYSLIIREPSQPRYGSSLPEVSCTEEVSGSAHIPENDVIVIANKPKEGPTWFFQRVGSPAGDNWLKSPVHFSAPGQPEAGQIFDLIAYAVPANTVSRDTWTDSDLPTPLQFSYLERVKRSNSLSGCNWQK